MRITAIRINNTKAKNWELKAIVQTLNYRFKRAGFLTNASIVNSTSIDIKLRHMQYAEIDTSKRGYNYRVNLYTKSDIKKGYKRTKSLSWNQRVELNHLINDVLDTHRVSATIRAMSFVIRDKVSGRVNEWEVPFQDNLGRDSFQPNYHDWIYESEDEARVSLLGDLTIDEIEDARHGLRLVAGGKE